MLTGTTTAPVEVRIPGAGLHIVVPVGTPCRKLGERAYWQVSDITSQASHYGVRIPADKVMLH